MKSMLKILISSTVMFSAANAYAAAENYTLDPNHTNVFWHASHMGFSTPSGKFGDVKGTLALDEASPAASKVNVTIAMNNIVTGIEKFDTHLKSADFFDSEKFPTATFVSDKVEVTGKDTAKVSGTLTLKGVAKPAVLAVKLNKIGENPMTKVKTAGFTASTTIKRSDFGISYAIPAVPDEVVVTIESEATKQ